MANFICYDRSGDVLRYLYQWDVKRFIDVRNIEVWDGATVHFNFTNTDHQFSITVNPTLQEKGESGWVDVVTSAQANESEEESQEEQEDPEPEPEPERRYIARIPDEILQFAKPIILLIYQTTHDDENLTIDEMKITVLPRTRPSEYSYTPTVPALKIPDGLELDDTILYITSDGERIGNGVDIGGGGSPTIWVVPGAAGVSYLNRTFAFFGFTVPVGDGEGEAHYSGDPEETEEE